MVETPGGLKADALSSRWQADPGCGRLSAGTSPRPRGPLRPCPPAPPGRPSQEVTARPLRAAAPRRHPQALGRRASAYRRTDHDHDGSDAGEEIVARTGGVALDERAGPDEPTVAARAAAPVRTALS
ncbi:hypothetical protein HBB16_06915 [Pseudonocardia sp. MCCB 268]|nr:hypothetical protein [Pseudonocardia cytotoxica]